MARTFTTAGPSTAPDTAPARGLHDMERYESIPQYSLAQAVTVWAAATPRMAVLVWAVAPWLSHRLAGSEQLPKALFICFTAVLLWMLALSGILA